MADPTPTGGLPRVSTGGCFYEEDEPVEKITAAFEAGEKGVTADPTPEDVYREPVEDLYREVPDPSEIRDPAPGVPDDVFEEFMLRARVEADPACPACRLHVEVLGQPCDEHRFGAALAYAWPLAEAAGREAGYGQGRDDEANGEDLPEWYRLATGETCRPGQPYACGDYHHNGKCVRERHDAQ